MEHDSFILEEGLVLSAVDDGLPWGRPRAVCS